MYMTIKTVILYVFKEFGAEGVSLYIAANS